MEAPRSEEMQPVGRLHLFSSDRGPEKDFLLYPGQNTIGRSPDCTVILPFPSISEVHAVIEIPAEGRAPFVRDCSSRNGTYAVRPLRRLSPGMNHQLNDKDIIHFSSLHVQFHYLGPSPLPDPEGAIEVEEIPTVPVMGKPPLQGTSLAKDSQEEGDHGLLAFLPGKSSDLQPGSPEKATSSRNQATDNPKMEIKGQSVQNDMDNQDKQDSPDVRLVSNKAPGSEAPASAWSPRRTRSQKKRTSKRVHFSASPVEKPAPETTGSQSKRAGGVASSTWKFQPGVKVQHLTAVTMEPSPCPKEQGRRQPQKRSARDKENKPVEVETAGSSSQRETQEPVTSSFPPTTSLATELHPAILKQLSIRTESQEPTPKRQKQGAPRKHVSTPAEKPAPETTGSQRKRAGGVASSTWKFQPRVKIQHLTAVTKEPSPCPKEQGRRQPQKRSGRDKENKPVEVETSVKTPKRGAELAIQPQEKVKRMPHQSVGQPSLDEEVRALRSGREIRMKSRTFQPTAQEEAQKEQAGKEPDIKKAKSLPESSE